MLIVSKIIKRKKMKKRITRSMNKEIKRDLEKDDISTFYEIREE